MNSRKALQPVRCLGSAWGLTKQSPAALWLAGLLIMVVGSMSTVLDLLGMSPALVDLGVRPVVQLGLFSDVIYIYWMGVNSVVAVVAGLALAWLRLGYYRGVRAAMRRDSVEFGDMFETAGRWWSFCFTSLLSAGLLLLASVPPFLVDFLGHMIGGTREEEMIAVLIGQLLYLPVWLYLVLGLTWMMQACALEELGPVASLKRSWQLARGKRWPILRLAVFTVVFGLLGFFACLVGMIPVIILVEIMWVESFVQITERPGTSTDEPSVDPELAGAPGELGLGAEPASGATQAESRTGDGPFDPGAWRESADIPPIDGPGE